LVRRFGALKQFCGPPKGGSDNAKIRKEASLANPMLCFSWHSGEKISGQDGQPEAQLRGFSSPTAPANNPDFSMN
jgi:hypothetical protein